MYSSSPCMTIFEQFHFFEILKGCKKVFCRAYSVGALGPQT